MLREILEIIWDTINLDAIQVNFYERNSIALS